MKVKRYYTTKGADLFEDTVFPSEMLNGVRSVRHTDEVMNKDFRGFGVAITGSSCYNLSLMSEEKRTELLKNIYGKDGLGLSVGRISVASSDYSPEVYSYDDVVGDVELKHFSIERDMVYVIPMIKEILKISPDIYLFASPWSPPGWMKTGGSIGGGYMRREFIDCYAEYIVRFIKEYAECGIKISALTPQNEPEADQGGHMPACRWHPDIEAEFVIALRKKLKENGLDVEIWLHDHNFAECGRVQWMLDAHPDLPTSCNGVAFHYYSGRIEDTLPLGAAYPDLSMHFTEGGPRLYDNYGTDCCKWGIMMSKVLNCGYKSFTGWNLMLDQFGGPNIGPFFCGGLVTRDSQTEELEYSGQYKAFLHFARFMKPGATVYRTEPESPAIEMFSFSNGKADIPPQVSCVKNPDGSVCYFLINSNTHKEQVQIFEGGRWYYVELLPETLCTVVFEND